MPVTGVRGQESGGRSQGSGAVSPTLSPVTTTQRNCGERASRQAGKSLSLPLLTSAAPRVRKSKSGPRRAAVLIAVHLVVAIHIAQWLYTGMTLSPVEPSESMYTLNQGLLNAGFIFFILAIASTILFGRVFCGWGCHVVALQDFCGWLMKKCGVHPRPFRARLLTLAPLGLALYMFVWPTFRREVIQPSFAAAGTPMPVWLGPEAPRPEIHNEFFVKDFWATFPEWYVAIPFLAVCGFATVYFLGSKGFCTYACPYGGFFGPADTVAFGRIVVNENCEHCGHCTAVCTSNVRVHEEVRDYGMVINPGCMKCMDCVSVCPNDALRFAITTPPILSPAKRARIKSHAATRRQRSFDLTRAEELWVAGLFLVLLLGFRGFLNEVPLLMAAGLAAIGSFSAWKLWTMLRVPNVRLQSLQLRYRGRWTPAGWLFAPIAAALLLAGIWGAVVKYHLWRGTLLDSQVQVSAAQYLAPDFSPTETDRATAEAAIRHLTRAGPPGDGGIGWTRAAEVTRQLASLHAICGRFDTAERYIREAVAQAEPTEEFLVYASHLLLRRGGTAADAASMYRSVIHRFPRSASAHVALAGVQLSLGDLESARSLCLKVLDLPALTPGPHAGAAAILRDMGDLTAARRGFAAAVALNPRSGVLLAELALTDFLLGNTAEALAGIDRAIDQEPQNTELVRRKAEMLRALGREAEAAQLEATVPPDSGRGGR